MNASLRAYATAPRYPRLLTLEVLGGYLDGLLIVFAAHATCIIGGKGCGKTTLFEMIRFGLAATSLTAKDPAKLLKKNLGAGTVRIGFETEHGVRYIAERRLADEQPSYFTFDPANREPVKLGPDVFTVEAYGQDEIELVGENRKSQRGLIDRLAGDAIRAHVVEIASLTEGLRESAKVLLALEAEIAALESGAAEARAIEQQLEPLLAGSGADAALVTKAHAAKGLRGREKQAVASARTALADVQTGAAAFAASMRAKLAAVLSPEVRAGANGALVTELEAQLAGVSGAIETLAGDLGRRVESTGAPLTDVQLRLTAAHAEQDAQYEALLARQKEDQARVDERTRLQERHTAVAASIPRLEERTRLHAQLRTAHERLAERLVEARDQRTRVRMRVQQKHKARLEGDGVRIRVEQDQGNDEYRAYLRDVLSGITGGQPKWLLDKIVPAIRPDELVAIVRAQDVESLVARAGLTSKNLERARQAIGALTPNVHLYALQSVALDDEVIITTRHGESWKDTVECSPGQRSGAILPILLLEGGAPLLIDQPDDNVDPDYMCSSILPRIAALRGARQFVFVTHHANVPVLSGADQIILMGSNGVSGGLQAEGSIQRMKGWVVAKLEGGEGAFETRKKAYEQTSEVDVEMPRQADH